MLEYWGVTVNTTTDMYALRVMILEIASRNNNLRFKWIKEHEVFVLKRDE